MAHLRESALDARIAQLVLIRALRFLLSRDGYI